LKNYSKIIASMLFIQSEFSNNTLVNIAGGEALSDYFNS